MTSPSTPRSIHWIEAARPHTLPAAAAPVIVGTALAIRDGVFRWDVFVVTLLAAVAIQVGVNYANDAADGARGVDADRVGPERAVAAGLISPSQMWKGVGVAFGVAILGGLYLTAVAGPLVIAIGAASILAALGYTSGPAPYGYRGMGEIFVFVFFGLVATVGTRFVFDGELSAGAWEAGMAMGLFAAAILVANNLRDLEGDRGAGKRTLAVLMGSAATRRLYTAMIVVAYLAVVVAVARGAVPPATLVVLASVPLAVRPWRLVWTATDGERLVTALQDTARLQLVASALWFAGVVFG